MTKAVNYETKDIRTKDGNLRFGHIHKDNVKSSVLLQGQGGLEYITIDQTDPRKGWITSRCRGAYSVKCGDNIEKGQPAMWFDAASGDIVISTRGRIIMEAENIEMIAHGGSAIDGNIFLTAPGGSVFVDSKKISLTAREVVNIFSPGTIQITAENILKTYGGTIEKLTGAGVKLMRTTAFKSSISNLPK